MSAQDEIKEMKERIAELTSYLRQAEERMLRADSADRASAALVRAVVVLREIRPLFNRPSWAAKHELRERIDVILTDAESTTAADEYEREQEERTELEALVRNMANPGMLMGSLAESWITMHRMRARDLMSKIDARRAGAPRE